MQAPASERGLMLIEWLIVIAIIVVLLSIPLFAKVRCEAQWAESGFQTKWGLFSGCLISKDGERYIPDKRYREIADD